MRRRIEWFHTDRANEKGKVKTSPSQTEGRASEIRFWICGPGHPSHPTYSSTGVEGNAKSSIATLDPHSGHDLSTLTVRRE